MSRTTKLAVWGILALSFIIRGLFFSITDDGYGGDAPGRVIYALEWKEKPVLIQDLNFGPLPFYLMGGILCLWDDPFLAPRLISLFFGALAVLPLYGLARLIFGTRVALYSAVLFCFYAMQVKFSVLTTAEAVFQFGLLSALYFLFKYKDYDQSPPFYWLLLSAFFLTAANMSRFEGWLFLPLFIITLYRSRITHILFFSAASLILPFLWMSECYRVSGDPFIFSSVSAREIRTAMDNMFPFGKRLIGWPDVLIGSFSWPVAAAGFFGVVYGMFRKRYFFLSLMFVSVLAVFTYRTVRGDMALFIERYSLTLGILLIPFSMLVFSRITDVLPRPVRLGAAALLFTWMAYSCAAKLAYYIPTSLPEREGMMVPDYVKSAAEWLRRNVPSGERVLIDQDGSLNPNLILYARLKPGQYVYVPMGFDEYIKKVDADSFSRELLRKDPSYVTVFHKGVIGKFLSDDNSFLRVGNISLKLEPGYRGQRYSIYKVLKQ